MEIGEILKDILRYGLILVLCYLAIKRIILQISFNCDKPVCQAGCRAGYTKNGGICYRNCDGVKVGPALCRERCRDGYTDVAGNKTRSKHSYIPATRAQKSYIPQLTSSVQRPSMIYSGIYVGVLVLAISMLV